MKKKKKKKKDVASSPPPPKTLISGSAPVNTHCRLSRELDHTKHVEKDNGHRLRMAKWDIIDNVWSIKKLNDRKCYLRVYLVERMESWKNRKLIWINFVEYSYYNN